jgi:hypothetical protein
LKVGILTHYNVNNQGAQLQMYATYNKLKEMGHTPVVLTYPKNFDFVDEGLKKRNIVTISSIPYFLKEYLFKKGLRLTWFNVKKYIKNRKFRENEFVFERYALANTDLAIVGADEVFSLENGLNMMMFGHCVGTKRIVSYAPSCGQTNVDIYKKYNAWELVKSGLNKFSNLSARDENTFDVITKATGKNDVELVIDPVLLYDFSKIHQKVKLPKKDYILVYSYDKNMNKPEEITAIKEYAKNNNLKIVSAGTYHKWCDYNFSCNGLEWIEYFRNAKEVITDTFHGTILATITKKPMGVYVREGLNKNKLEYLLKQLKIEERRLNKVDYGTINKVMRKEINFYKIDKNLDELRKNSNSYFMKCLGE